MNYLKKLFEEKRREILAVYFTAGYPDVAGTADTVVALAEAGADIVEIGMPFSDPLADGSTIQHSSKVALEQGMTLELLFSHLQGLRQRTRVPLVLMGYLNPVLQFGLERFCQRCREVGVDGLILPDMPLHWYQRHCKTFFEENGLCSIFLVTPQTSNERILQLDDASTGFLYAVSSNSTTGTGDGFGPAQKAYFQRLASMQLKNPVLVGFGISGSEDLELVCGVLHGGVVGSAFIRAQQAGLAPAEFVQNLRGPNTQTHSSKSY